MVLPFVRHTRGLSHELLRRIFRSAISEQLHSWPLQVFHSLISIEFDANKM
jgi:hypothetical protein